MQKEQSQKQTLKKRSISDLLKGLLRRKDGVAAADDDRLTVHEIVDGLHERGFGVLMLLFALPLSIPMPVPPGYTTILGFPLLIFSYQMTLGRSAPWIPAWLGKKAVRRATLAKLIEKTAPLLMAIERVMRPRLLGEIPGSVLERVCGLVCLADALSIAIPLPLTNFIPAGGIALIALGLMSRDGIFLIGGFVLSLVGLALTGAVLVFGAAAVQKMVELAMKFLGF
jgi:hypothetical protein